MCPWVIQQNSRGSFVCYVLCGEKLWTRSQWRLVLAPLQMSPGNKEKCLNISGHLFPHLFKGEGLSFPFYFAQLLRFLRRECVKLS